MSAEICFCCKKPSKSYVTFFGEPDYGSRFDSTLLCEEKLLVVVCDDCMFDHQRQIQIMYSPRPETPLNTYRPWSPYYDCNEPAMTRLDEALKSDPHHNPDHPDYVPIPSRAAMKNLREFIAELDRDAYATQRSQWLAGMLRGILEMK